jgi:hypothetical protein
MDLKYFLLLILIIGVSSKTYTYSELLRKNYKPPIRLKSGSIFKYAHDDSYSLYSIDKDGIRQVVYGDAMTSSLLSIIINNHFHDLIKDNLKKYELEGY